MGVLAGIVKFDPRSRVDEAELTALSAAIARLGPDGGGRYISANVGMLCSAFHTTPDSRSEQQPLVQRDCILTWDGRLDNREELRSRLGKTYDDTTPDIDLVFASYQEWRTGCFTELLGDWALALWDGAQKRLTLARDYIGVRRLFYRLDEEGIVWCSSLEPLVLESPRKLHLDIEYLAGYLCPPPPIESTPYKEIRAVLPSHIETFDSGGSHARERYWTLRSSDRIRYSDDAEYEQHFREVFRTSVARRLRADRPIIAELSGGLDSSSIVCIADDILRDSSGVPLETLSYYDTDEPSGDERPYFSLVEQRRGRVGHHISKSIFALETSEDALRPLPSDTFAAAPGYFSKSLRWASLLDEVHTKHGSRVTLSGLGGDEILGGVQYEAPELGDYLVRGDLISFARSLYSWSIGRKKTVFQLIGDTMGLLRANRNPHLLLSSTDRRVPWARFEQTARHNLLPQFADWLSLSPTQLTMEWLRYNLASQLTCTDPPLVGCAERRYPLLDRSVFVFLASIPRTQVLRADRRRYLMRRALNGIVPDCVLHRKSKWFGFRRSLLFADNRAETVEKLFADPWLSDPILFDSALVRKGLTDLEHGASYNGMELLSAVAIEQWLRSLLRRGCIDLGADWHSASMTKGLDTKAIA